MPAEINDDIVGIRQKRPTRTLFVGWASFFFLSCFFLLPGTCGALSERKIEGTQAESFQFAAFSMNRSQQRQGQRDRFTTQKDGIIVDSQTGLEWICGPDKDMTWYDVKQWLDGLSKLHGGGWRMPTRKEIRSVYFAGSGTRNLPEVMTTSGWYVWTSEMMGAKHAWGFCLDIGDSYFPRLTFSTGARGFAVRAKRSVEQGKATAITTPQGPQSGRPLQQGPEGEEPQKQSPDGSKDARASEIKKDPLLQFDPRDESLKPKW